MSDDSNELDMNYVLRNAFRWQDKQFGQGEFGINHSVCVDTVYEELTNIGIGIVVRHEFNVVPRLFHSFLKGTGTVIQETLVNPSTTWSSWYDLIEEHRLTC